MVLGDRMQAELWVCFNPDYCQGKVSRVMDEVTVMYFLGEISHIMFYFFILGLVQKWALT